jgi:dihydroorotase
MTDLVLAGGTVVSAAGVAAADVAVRDGRIVAIGADLDRSGAEVLDCRGCWVGPGLVDVHVHFRDPGLEWKEDIETGSRAAAAGGFTAVLAMPNTDPPIDTAELARFVVDRGRRVGLADVRAVGCVTRGRAGAAVADLEGMFAAGVRVFSDDGDSVLDGGVLRRALETLARLGGVLSQHAEDPGLSAGGHLNEGEVSARLGLVGSPVEAEQVVVARDLAVVRMTGARYHVQHVSSAGTVALVRSAKAEGLPVTGEAAPHHLSFDESAVLAEDPSFKMFPPLRTAADVAAVRAALADGVLDCVATDHAPHAPDEKAVGFEAAPRGVIGLETAVAAVLAAVAPGPAVLFDRMSVAPARIAGLAEHGRLLEPGGPATITVIDPGVEWVADRFASRSSNSPWRGRTLRGRARHVLLRGRPTLRDQVPAA